MTYTQTSCDGSFTKHVFVGGTFVGWIFFALHAVANLASLTPTNGMQLGTMHYFATGDCNPGPHLHVEMSDNKDGGPYSCWTDNGQPGVTLNEGDAVGMLGTFNTAPKQACGPTTDPGPAYHAVSGTGSATLYARPGSTSEGRVPSVTWERHQCRCRRPGG